MESRDRPLRTKSARSSQSIRPRSTDVQNVLVNNNSASSTAKPSPAEHVTSPTSPSTSTRSAGSGGSARHSFQSHGRTMSMANSDTAAATSLGHARSNRFSLSFPIQPARETTAPSPTKHSARSPSRETTNASESVASPTGPSDSNILTAIAAQERRVLELKEELQRAEKELELLKRQWVTQEAQKKRNDVRKVTKLQPLNTGLAGAAVGLDKGVEGVESASAWLQQEMERRKALLSGPKSSSRTVFKGSRHTRTLSLLSPDAGGGVARELGAFPPRLDSLPSGKRMSGDREKQFHQQRQMGRPQPVTRASTTPDLTTEVADHVDADGDLSAQGVDRETLIKGGRQMASHFKDGFWTFFEDLRQATIGDEATQAQQATGRRESAQNPRVAQKQGAKGMLTPLSRTSTISTGSTETRRPGARSPLQSRTSSARTPTAEQPSLLDMETGNFFNQQTLSTLEATPAPIKKPSSAHGKSPSKASNHSTEAWEAWTENETQQSPKDGRSSSSATSDSNTLPSTTRTSLNLNNRESLDTISSGSKGPLPWPALSSYGPLQLKRTASNLMSEWDRALTPSPGTEHTGQDDYLGLGAEAAASEMGRQGKDKEEKRD